MENDEYKKEIYKIIDNLDNSFNLIDKWECIKRKIKKNPINLSKYQQRLIKKRKKENKRDIENIETKTIKSSTY